MTQTLTLLIVEDEPALAEIHAEFACQFCSRSQIWLAESLEQARRMLVQFNPSLILLDNYLPDGEGITLLREIAASNRPCGVVFTTAASDMKTVSEAISAGAFDYLIKPVSYRRLSQTLQRYQQRLSAQENGHSVNQRQIDDMFNAYARDGAGKVLPVGIDEITLAKISALFTDEQKGFSAETVAEALNLSRTTARRYLEYAAGQRLITAEIAHGRVGRPQRIYRAAKKATPG